MNKCGASHYILIEGARACFRRPEFTQEVVSYDVMPPLFAQRLLATLGLNGGGVTLARIHMLTRTNFEWCELLMPQGRRRILALQNTRVVLEVASADDLSSKDRVTKAINEADGIYLGFSEFPASLSLLPAHAEIMGPFATDEVIDLGWLPLAKGEASRRTTTYQRTTLLGGVIDLTAQDPSLRAG